MTPQHRSGRTSYQVGCFTVKYAWIDKMAAKDLWWFSIALACVLVAMSRSGFYDWRTRRQRPPTQREREEQLLVAAIVEHLASN